jgi:hypothetical protein
MTDLSLKREIDEKIEEVDLFLNGIVNVQKISGSEVVCKIDKVNVNEWHVSLTDKFSSLLSENCLVIRYDNSITVQINASVVGNFDSVFEFKKTDSVKYPLVLEVDDYMNLSSIINEIILSF